MDRLFISSSYFTAITHKFQLFFCRFAKKSRYILSHFLEGRLDNKSILFLRITMPKKPFIIQRRPRNGRRLPFGLFSFFQCEVLFVRCDHRFHRRASETAFFQRAHALDRAARRRTDDVLQLSRVLSRFPRRLRSAFHRLCRIKERLASRLSAGDRAVGERF